MADKFKFRYLKHCNFNSVEKIGNARLVLDAEEGDDVISLCEDGGEQGYFQAVLVNWIRAMDTGKSLIVSQATVL